MSFGVGSGFYTLGPSDEKPRPYTGMRRYWMTYRNSAFLSNYDAGVALGKADVVTYQADVAAGAKPDATSLVGYASIQSVVSQLRDDAWDAQLDGWRDATRAVIGTTLLSNGF